MGAPGEVLSLNGWGNSYVIVGSSAAALIGLTFIVITIAVSVTRTHSAGGISRRFDS